jgi:putative salt-induced outer membrane protein
MTITALLGCLLWAPPVPAQAPPPGAAAGAADGRTEAVATDPPATAPPPSAWGGEAEAGILATGGNTETESINTKLKIENERRRWRHRLNGLYYRSSDSGTTTAKRTTGTFKSDYQLTDADYLYGVVRYDSDRFSGYDAQTSETAGYGRRIPLGAGRKAELEAGAGGRQTRYVDGTRRSVAILRLAAKYTQVFWQASEFREEVLVESATDNTYTESVTSLKTKVNGNLSMKMAFTWTHNSYVPQDVRQTDTITSVTLVYDI